MKLTKVIYICSPYTYKHDDKGIAEVMQEYRYNEVTKIIGKLQIKYPYAFIGPITQGHNTVKHMKKRSNSFKDWRIRDFSYIKQCHEVWIICMDGWKDSIGVQKEIQFATHLKTPVKYIDPKTLNYIPGKV